MNNKGQSIGMVTGLVFGIASLVIAVIVAFVIVSTLSDAGLLESDSVSVTNESGHVNATSYTLDGASYTGATGYAITALWNVTDANGAGSYNLSIPVGNATVSTTGVVTNATSFLWDDTYISYTYTRDSNEQKSETGLSGNLTSGVHNVSSKLPTVLLVAAIILILSILAVLVGVWQKMRIGTGQL